MNRNYLFWILCCFVFASCTTQPQTAVKELQISRVESMPNQPQPYKMLDWHEKAVNFDEAIFDFDATGEFRPFIWLDNAKRNLPQTTFGLYTVIGDVRQGPNKNKGEFHEAINSLGALMSAGLVGIDKRDQKGYNYVKMVQNYFNTDNGWNIMMNNTCPKVALLGGGYGRDWWYDVFPNVLYYAVSELQPNVEGADAIQKTIAEQFFKADSTLNGNYDYSYFDYAEMKGKRNQIPYQQDAAAGHAYVLYSAYQKFGDPRYLEGAKSAIEALLSQKESRFYEVLMPFGAYVAARLNAEQGTNYDVSKILDWTFDGCTAEKGRTGWGIIADRWGDYDVSGIQGSLIQDGGYGFLMNTFDMAWPLIPMVRYDQKYARSIGKWMLNAANSTRLFYPYEIPDGNQYLPENKSITRNVIAYEGLKKVDAYNTKEFKGVSPVALGDGPNWVVSQPKLSMFSIYGSAHAGIFGSIIRKTNVEKILQLDCLATDFYKNESYPTYLYFNPYDEVKKIDYSSEQGVDLYDIVSGKLVAEKIFGKGSFSIEGNKAMVVVEIPAGSKIERSKEKVTANGIVISFF
ncbi:hypothetical protein BZG01_10095 [Labilibaculum manganireducens]|uniref:D-glucuronyl C5-epimerase C-terminal domain-containing protein n=1 Tax=Labilibaculum manganireducens TaxID=1940525 RepID=A0A2N3I8Q0_9BACT|nr:hypothetical protein [Labilibaculum manganireducens]PKQ66623.1 hypothetical protein BZG01_10095 [Labilibaculum manganireducens]